MQIYMDGDEVVIKIKCDAAARSRAYLSNSGKMHLVEASGFVRVPHPTEPDWRLNVTLGIALPKQPRQAEPEPIPEPKLIKGAGRTRQNALRA